jgi:polyhydroxyalkanoate synthesis repressor PhaR
MSETVIIRKYENRRLYDTAGSRYVNLEDLARMVREGVDLRVVDARTNEDLTRVILTQIIVEDAKERDSSLPLDFLRQMVIASGRATQEGFARYMQAVFESYQRAYQAIQDRLREGAPMTMMPLDFMQAMFGPKAPGAAARPASAEAEEAPNASSPEGDLKEITDLRRRIDELERRLAAEPRRTKRTGSKRR